MSFYKVLNKQVFSSGEYSIVPVRMADRYVIMQWRNEQIDILRQKEHLTKEKQDLYFKTVITKLFVKKNPEQLIFSFLHKGKLVGYGGLVHIDWNSKHAEISFLLSSNLNYKEYYLNSFKEFLKMIVNVAENASLFKVYTFGYDIMDYRFRPLYSNGFHLEAYLHEHVLLNSEKKAVRIYSKLLNND